MQRVASTPMSAKHSRIKSLTPEEHKAIAKLAAQYRFLSRLNPNAPGVRRLRERVFRRLQELYQTRDRWSAILARYGARRLRREELDLLVVDALARSATGYRDVTEHLFRNVWSFLQDSSVKPQNLGRAGSGTFHTYSSYVVRNYARNYPERGRLPVMCEVCQRVVLLKSAVNHFANCHPLLMVRLVADRHRGMPALACPYCGCDEFADVGSLARHLANRHSAQMLDVLPCRPVAAVSVLRCRNGDEPRPVAEVLADTQTVESTVLLREEELLDDEDDGPRPALDFANVI